MKEEKEKKKNVWNYILIVFVILGIIVGYLSYLQDKKMDKMLEELDRKKMEQIDPIEI
jgi:heme/copper-type cytochrome/quinol oxidase subunit 4